MLRSVLRTWASAGALALALAAGASAATAPGPPAAITDIPTGVSETKANLAGLVDPAGFDTTVHFEWGTDTTYGQQAPADPEAIPALEADGSPAGNTRVRATIENLTPGTTYHFRVVATNQAGTTFGEDRSFVAQQGSKPLVVTGNATVDPSFTKVTLTGTVNPNGQDTTYKFHIATSEAQLGQNAPPAAMQTPRQPPTGQPALSGTADIPVSQDYPSTRSHQPLVPGTTYFYRLVATNSSGTTLGPVKSFTAGNPPPPPPPPPAQRPPDAATLPAAGVTAAGAQLKGAVNPKGQPTTYRFEYGPTTAYGALTPPVAAGAGTVPVPAAATIGGLKAGTVYHYRIVATNASGTARGADVAFRTPAAGTLPPGKVAGTDPGQAKPTRDRLSLRRLRATPNRVRVRAVRGCTTTRAMRTKRCKRAFAKQAIRVRFTASRRSRVAFTIRRGSKGRVMTRVFRSAKKGVNVVRLPVLVKGRPLRAGLYTITAVAGRGELASKPARVRVAVRVTPLRTRSRA